jgi:phosphonatase-like hydrolase
VAGDDDSASWGSNQMRPIKLVVFDIAGTTIEDHGEVLSSFRIALKMNGISAPENELREWKGASKREVIRHFVERQTGPHALAANQTIDKVYGDFRKMLEGHYQNNGVMPIRGVKTTFDWLLDHDIHIATTTGFYREVNDLILKKAGWEKIFRASVCSDDVVLGRPAPFMIFHAMEAAQVTDVSQVMNVGDTPLDLQAGVNAGVRGVLGVLTGTHTEERLKLERHTHILSSVAEIPALLEREFGLG